MGFATRDVASESPSIAIRVTVVGILLLHAGILIWSGYHHSPGANEFDHLPAGISHLHFGNFDLYRVNPPLVRMVAALPVAIVRPSTDWTRYTSDPLKRSNQAVGYDFLVANEARLRWLFTTARWACVSFSVLGGYVCFCWTGALFGKSSGLMAMASWCFLPCILGPASTMMPDAHAAAVGLAAMFCCWRWLKRPSWLEAIVAGIVLGLAELCKFTLLVFYPLLPLLWVAYRLPERKTIRWGDWTRQCGMLAVTMAISVWIVNCGYLFEESFTPLEEFRFQSMMFTGHRSLGEIPPEGANRFAGTWLGKLPVPLPANFVQGIDTQRLDFERGLPSYLRGQWADHGWWYYYLYALAIKMPLGTWCLVAMAVGATIFGQRKGTVPFSSDDNRGSPQQASWRDEMVALAPFVVILVFVSSQTGFSVHSRYVIPALPFLFVWTSKIARVFEMRPFTKKRLAMAAGVVLALAWSVGSSLSIYPHSLSYFNELAVMLPTPADASYPQPLDTGSQDHGILAAIGHALSAGPRNGPRHLLDSNIDWGQDLFYLKDWLDEHREVKLDGLACYGSYPATLAGIPEAPHPVAGPQDDARNAGVADNQFGPRPGWYALSVNYIYGRDRQYRYFLNFEPVAMAGYSIYIYHITLDEANRVRRKLGMLELAGEGSEGR